MEESRARYSWRRRGDNTSRRHSWLHPKGQEVYHPQAYRSGIKADISATRSSFTSSTTVSVTCPRKLSFIFISWAAIDYSCFTAIFWLTSSATTKEGKKKEPEKQDKPMDPTKLNFFIIMCESNKRKFIDKPLLDYDRSIKK